MNLELSLNICKGNIGVYSFCIEQILPDSKINDNLKALKFNKKCLLDRIRTINPKTLELM